MLNAVDLGSFPSQKGCPKASEILRGTISKFRYTLYTTFLQKVSMSERIKKFKWHSITTQIMPIAHILVLCLLNYLNLYQL